MGGRPERRLPFRNACAARLRTRGTLAGIWDPETSSLCCAPWRCARLRSPCSHGHLIQASAEDGATTRLGVHGAGGQRLCAGPLWISDLQAASGCSASLERAQAVPFRFACLRPAAGCCSLFIDSSQRAWGSRHQSAPEQPRLDPR